MRPGSQDLRRYCESVYRRYHRPQYISPDPLEIVREYDNPAEREIAAFISASLALGRVDGIVRAARRVMGALGAPAQLQTYSDAELRELSRPFVYRFFDGRQLYGLLLGMRRVLEAHGSLEACAGVALRAGNAAPDVPPAVRALRQLVDSLVEASDAHLRNSILVARPEKGSACKRLFLFLRWMVRSDLVDPGGWTVLAPADLFVPVDTHMLAIARSLGLTSARQPSIAVSREITAAFRRISPADPARYDFSLTRMGIHPAVREEVRRDDERSRLA
jgi:uncharacterized protein (TIGR02757 family)